MPVLVDGNNLLYAAQAAEAADLLVGRSMLCDTLGSWAQRRSEQVHVVFDGPKPHAPRATQIGHPDIQVTYSGAGTNADAVVIRIIETDSAARRLTVVSSDREIARAARRRRALPVRAEDFWLRVKRELAEPLPTPAEPKEKRDGLDPQSTTRWLKEFGLDDSR